MHTAVTNSNAANPSPLLTSLYRHVKCPDWGLGILVHEQADRRTYQFEDGKVRTIKQGYYSFLISVAEEDSSVREKLAVLCARSRVAPMASDASETTLGDQLALFRSQYPGGFADPAWLSKQRGEGAKRRIKRHRDAAIAHARERLSREALDTMIAERRNSDIVQVVAKVLGATDLVTKKQLQPLHEQTVFDYDSVAAAVRDLLYSDAALDSRFDALRQALTTRKSRPSWQLCTALTALVHPHEHLCVRPGIINAQAKILRLRASANGRPNGAAYVRLLAVARSVSKTLTDSGLPPRDFLDVYDFMWATLRPSARRQLGRLPNIAPGVPDVAARPVTDEHASALAAAA